MLIGLIVQNYKSVMKTTSTPFWSLFMNLFKLEIEPVLDNATGQLFFGKSSEHTFLSSQVAEIFHFQSGKTRPKHREKY